MGDTMILQHLAIGFGAGILAGIGLFTLFIAYQTKRIIKETKENVEKSKILAEAESKRLQEDLTKQARFNKQITDHIQQAGKIIEAQNNIAAAIRQPSSNALHSKHKNKLASDWKTLEDKKQEIFSSILKTGADPIVNVYDDVIKKTREMKLSELVTMMNGHAAPLDDTGADKKLVDNAGENATVTKVVRNGRTFHLISNKGNKSTH